MADVFIDRSPAHTEGRWVDWEDAKLLVAELPNERYNAALSRLREAVRSGALKLIAPEGDVRDAEVRYRAMGEAVLIGWRNLTSGGEPIEYSAETSFKVLMNNREIFATVMIAAQSEKEYRVTLADQLEKKPSRSRRGRSGTRTSTKQT